MFEIDCLMRATIKVFNLNAHEVSEHAGGDVIGHGRCYWGTSDTCLDSRSGAFEPAEERGGWRRRAGPHI
jgi:hypothetical protein